MSRRPKAGWQGAIRGPPDGEAQALTITISYRKLKSAAAVADATCCPRRGGTIERIALPFNASWLA